MVPVTLSYLLDRLRYPRTRANELAQLRARFAALSGTSDKERAVATEMITLKQKISALLPNVASCSSCNYEHPRPEGPWYGGYCCSAPTTNLFTDDEISALRASGVQFSDLRSINETQYGCVFRGKTGCSISPAQRPSICVRYLCVTLELELARSNELEEIDALCNQLKDKFEEFVWLRSARLEEEMFSTLMNEKET